VVDLADADHIVKMHVPPVLRMFVSKEVNGKYECRTIFLQKDFMAIKMSLVAGSTGGETDFQRVAAKRS